MLSWSSCQPAGAREPRAGPGSAATASRTAQNRELVTHVALNGVADDLQGQDAAEGRAKGRGEVSEVEAMQPRWPGAAVPGWLPAGRHGWAPRPRFSWGHPGTHVKGSSMATPTSLMPAGQQGGSGWRLLFHTRPCATTGSGPQPDRLRSWKQAQQSRLHPAAGRAPPAQHCRQQAQQQQQQQQHHHHHHSKHSKHSAPSSRKATRAVTGTVAQWQVSHRVKGSSDSLQKVGGAAARGCGG